MTVRPAEAFLERIEVERFGALAARSVGPFSPGLNVVFGKNEAGKTTLLSFVDGVLFGWRDAHGPQADYRPDGGQRAGSLVFSARPGATEAPADRAELSRGPGAEGLQGDAELVEDIDAETFRTMFALTGDELRSLRGTTDVTAKLLTAGSGTHTTPAAALREVEERMGALASGEAADEGAIAALSRECDEAKRLMEEAAAQAELHRAHHRELQGLQPEQEAMAARLAEADREVEALVAACDGAERQGAEREALQRELVDVRGEQERALARKAELEAGVGTALASLSGAEDAALREQLDALASQEARREHALEVARTNHGNSRAAYEALKAAQAADDPKARDLVQRTTKVGISTALTIVFLLAGVPVLLYGVGVRSLSYLALGSVLVLVALIMAAATLGMLLRPSRHDDAYEARVRDAQWVMIQDEKKLLACQQDAQRAREELAGELAAMGLGAAQGEVRRARALLDDAKDVRSQAALAAQRHQAAALRAAQIEERLSRLDAERAQLLERAHADASATTEELEELLARKERDRGALRDTADAISRRLGELGQELAHAQGARDLEHCKLRYEELRTRIHDAKADYARLALAKRMLEAAIAAWEAKSQPEVYAQASRLLAMMTEGRWTQVRLTEGGRLQVVDEAGAAREPRELSLGTCQQLYLALRMALLRCAANVGRAVPILADDILASFDADRRAGAARALAELARHRQVIVLTCHEEVVAELQAADPALALVRL